MSGNPWINSEELRRGNKVVQKVNIESETPSPNATLGPSSVGSAPCDSLGVFARKRLLRGDLIVTEKPALTALNFDGRPNCWAYSEPRGYEIVAVDCLQSQVLHRVL